MMKTSPALTQGQRAVYDSVAHLARAVAERSEDPAESALADVVWSVMRSGDHNVRDVAAMNFLDYLAGKYREGDE